VAHLLARVGIRRLGAPAFKVGSYDYNEEPSSLFACFRLIGLCY
jgi:hypothetical protein